MTLVAHTTSPRSSRFEVSIAVSFLKPGVFDSQNLVTIPQAKMIRKLGQLKSDDLANVEAAVRFWLNL